MVLSEEIGIFIGTYKDNPPFTVWRKKAKSLETKIEEAEIIGYKKAIKDIQNATEIMLSARCIKTL